jgi:hypothetical protein
MLHADATASVHRFAKEVIPAVEAAEAILA